MPPPTAPFVAATALLAVAGVAKTVRPADTANALGIAGFGVGPAVVRVGAGAEVILAAAAILIPGPATGVLVAAAYAGFAGFVLLALKKGWVLESCGCFGRPDTPPTLAHAGLNAAAAASAVWWTVAWGRGSGPAAIGRLFYQSPWHGGPLALLTLVAAGMAYLIWTRP